MLFFFFSERYIKMQLNRKRNGFQKPLFILGLWMHLFYFMFVNARFLMLPDLLIEIQFPSIMVLDSKVWIWNWCEHLSCRPEHFCFGLASLGICKPLSPVEVFRPFLFLAVHDYNMLYLPHSSLFQSCIVYLIFITISSLISLLLIQFIENS